MKEKKVVKFYNPYPFLVRVLNDLGQPQILAPQAHGKVQGGKYTQSKLELLPIKGQKIYKTGLGIDLRRLFKEDLVALASAVLAVEPEIEDLDKISKKDLIERISEKVAIKQERADIEGDSNKEEEEIIELENGIEEEESAEE